MKIYLDVILLINFGFDFLLLMTVQLILKERAKLYRILLGSIVGSLSIFFLFMKMSSLTLFLLKAGMSIIMILLSFGRKHFLKNMLYLYFISILLGGFLYFLNMQVSYKNEGLIFFYNGFHFNLFLLFLLSPIILYCYYKQSRYFQDTLSNVYQVDIYFKGKKFSYQGYLDTGNKLYDAYKHREVTLLYNEELYEALEEFLPISFETLSSNGFLKGIVVDKMVVDDTYVVWNALIGVSKNSFSLEGAEVILHGNLKGKI